MGFLLNSIEKQKIFMYTTIISSLAHVGFNFLLVPKYTYIGASIAVVATELLNFILLFYFINRYKYDVSLLKIIRKHIVASLVMFGVLYLITNLKVYFAIPIGAIVYFGVLFIIKGIGKEEIEIIKHFIYNKRF